MTNKSQYELKRALQRFQSERLNTTYADLKTDQEFAAIGDFFFNRLYAPNDFSFRNTSMKRLHQVLGGKVHGGMVAAVALVIELHHLTEALDDLMVAQMIDRGIGIDLTLDQYKQCYRALDNYDERIRQIDMSAEATRVFHGLSKKWIVGVSLKTVTTAASVLGIGKIMAFINEGYQAFRKIERIDTFIETIRERELAWHERMWETVV